MSAQDKLTLAEKLFGPGTYKFGAVLIFKTIRGHLRVVGQFTTQGFQVLSNQE